MPDSDSQYFYRVKRGKTLRNPQTGETLGTPGQLVPKEHRDLDPRACVGPVEGSDAGQAEGDTESPLSAGSLDELLDFEDEAELEE